MLSKYLITGITVIWIYYLRCLSPPSDMDQRTLSKPSIGISLTASYGAISIRHSDGSFEDVGRVEGDTNYVEMIKRLSSHAASHPSPPYASLDEMWNDIPRQGWRSLRKRMGLAASPDVKVISELVKKLLDLCEPDYLPQVVISYPGFPSLYKEDINDVVEYLGLAKLTGLYNAHPWEVYAAFAGHGMGLCEHYESTDRCKNEGFHLPVYETFLAEYTDQALLLHTTRLQTAVDVDCGASDPHVKTSFELGSSSSADGLSLRVSEFVYNFLHPWYTGELVPDELLIIMTGITDQRIQKAIQEAAERVVPHIRMLASNSEFVASRGSAELAWRVNSMELS